MGWIALAVLVLAAVFAFLLGAGVFAGMLLGELWSGSGRRARLAEAAVAAVVLPALAYWAPAGLALVLPTMVTFVFLRRRNAGARPPSSAELDRELDKASGELGLARNQTGALMSCLKTGALMSCLNGYPVTVDVQRSRTRITVGQELGEFTAQAGPPQEGDLQVGDPLLDGLVRLTGPAAAVLTMLDPVTRGQLADAVLLRGVAVRKGELFIEKPGTVYPAEALVQLVRSTVELAETLGTAARRQELPALMERANQDPLPMVRLAALVALDGRDPASTRAAWTDPLPLRRAAAALSTRGEALDALRADSAIEPALLALLAGSTFNAPMRAFALRALGELGTPAALPALTALGADGGAALSRLHQRYPYAGDAQLSLSQTAEEQGEVSLAAQPGALALTKR